MHRLQVQRSSIDSNVLAKGTSVFCRNELDFKGFV
jgi:hypothetical protein